MRTIGFDAVNNQRICFENLTYVMKSFNVELRFNFPHILRSVGVPDGRWLVMGVVSCELGWVYASVVQRGRKVGKNTPEEQKKTVWGLTEYKSV